MNKYILLFLFTLITGALQSQPEMKFVRYTSQQGLVYNDVLCIYQDHFGFMWFGTKYGCSRFDGIEFKNYQFDEDVPGTIGVGWVTGIVGDNNNRLWFAIAGTGRTFMRYDFETDKFVDISQSIKEQLNVKDKIFDIWGIYPDSDGYVWLTVTDNGLVRYDPEEGNVKAFAYQSDKREMSPVIKDFSKDFIWFPTWSGIFVYNKSTGLFTNYRNNPENPLSLASDNCTQVFRDSENQIWIGTYNGVDKLIPKPSGSPEFKHFVHEPQNPFSLSNNLVYDIAEDNNGNLLIATVNGLCLMDKKTNKIYRYFNNEIDDESINSNLIRSLYKDNQGDIWIATNAGVGKLQVKNFKSYSQSFYKNSISHNKVQYLCEAPNSNVWIATPRGIDVYNRKTKSFKFFAGVTQNNKGLYGAPLTFCPNKNEGMWIGAWNGGISYFDYATKKISNYIKDKEISQSINTVFSVLKDTKNNVWIGASKEGVYVYEEKTKKYVKFSYNDKNENTLSSNRIFTIMEDSESNIWVGTQNGLNKLIDFNNNAFKCYFPGIEIYQIIETLNKSLWLATNYGLYQFNRESEQFKKYNVDNGLGITVLGILEDSSQNLWVSTNIGLTRLKMSQDSVVEVTVYRQEEGLNVGNFLDRSCVKLSDGTMMFGGTEGFCMFHPSKIHNDTLPPQIVFTDLKVANRTVKIGDKINGQTILSNAIAITRQLYLNYKNNSFSIKFSGIQYNMPQYNKYCYRLEGYDPEGSEWHYTNANDREVDYMNLSKGDYVFKVKAANSYGVWNNKPSELKVTILPPWWQTLWFKILAVAVLVSVVLLIIRIRTYNLQKQKQTLKRIVEKRTAELKEMNYILSERTEELEQQMEQLARMNTEIEGMAKQLHEADQSKLSFFANVSHEFRTPLSLIISPLEKCLNMEEPVVWSAVKNNYLQLMHKNAKRLLRLINQVIDFRKMEHNEKKLNISNNNIVEFVKEVIEAFSIQAEQKDISLRLENQYPTINFWFDPDVMEKILYNLISNAIKYTHKGGNVSVQLTVNSQQSTTNNDQLAVNSNQSYDSPLNTDNCLLITVKDTGIGISKEDIDKIFNRFYRVETNQSFEEEGTGIGLSYAKELIELHKGKILVESVPGKGSVFTLEFPMREESNKESVNKKSVPVNLDYIHSMIDDAENKTGGQATNVGETIVQDNEQDTNKTPVLIVEDNVDLRKFIKNELAINYNVYEATNGKEGLELALQREPELIISDIMMPVMNGVELCKKIKSDENTSHIPLILLTAKGSEEDQIEGLETGADDYITKPFNIDVLKLKINNILLLRKRMREKFSQSLDIIPSEIAPSSIDQQFIQKALDVVTKNLHDYEFDNDAFVNQMNSSRTLVYRKIKNITGQSVSEFIRSIRLKAAAQLFLKGHNNIAEVSYKVGFKHQTDLTFYFNKMFGKTPTQFIKEKLSNK